MKIYFELFFMMILFFRILSADNLILNISDEITKNKVYLSYAVMKDNNYFNPNILRYYNLKLGKPKYNDISEIPPAMKSCADQLLSQIEYENSTLIPNKILVRNNYPEKIIIKMQEKAILKGKISKSFIEKNKIKGKVKPSIDDKFSNHLSLSANYSNGGYNCNLKEDYTFEVSLDAGKYDITLLDLEPGEATGNKIIIFKQLEIFPGKVFELNTE